MRRAYAALLRLLPPGVGEGDRGEIEEMFAALWADARSPRRRARVLARALAGLAVLLVLEWTDHLGRGRGSRRRKGDGMVGAWSAVRHGARTLVRTPSFTLSVVSLLGLGIGAVTTIFSVVDHVVLRPLPYPASERLVKVEEGAHSGPTFRLLEGMESVEAWAGVSGEAAILTGGEEPLRVQEAHVTRDFFPLFGGRPAVGRLFVDGDWQAGEPVVLSHALWERVWGGDPAVVGQTIRIDGESRVVVGVVERSFVPPEGLDAGAADLYTPVDWSLERYTADDYWVLSVAGRLRSEVPLERAQAEADAVAARRGERAPDQFIGRDGSIRPLPLTPLREATVGSVRAGLGLIFGAVALLLLVACVNVAHLFLARGVERVREMAVRRALGAATPALARQLAVESLLVGLAGAAVGVGLAWSGIAAYRALGAGSLPRMASIAIDVRVLAFAVVVGLATSLVFGLLPALRLAGGGRGESPLRLAGRGSTPGAGTQAVRHGLVVVEVALSLVLAAQAGWLIRSFTELHGTDLGVRTEHVWTVPLNPTGIETGEEWYRRLEGIREALAETPGVLAASFGLSMPLEYVGGTRCCWRMPLRLEGDDSAPDDGRAAAMHPVDAGYFDLLGLRLEAGRSWSRAEETGARDAAVGTPVVISESLALQVYGSAAGAVGRTVETAGGPEPASFVIVGVAADSRHYGPDQDHGPALYLPASAIPFGPALGTMAVRMDGERQGVPRLLAEAIWRVEPELPVPVVRSMDDWADRATARARFVSGLFTAFGAVALLLVAGGLAGTLLYTVRLRRRELGIRLALGATPVGLEGDVMRRGAVLALAGTVLGGVAAWMAGRLLEGLVVDARARDVETFALSLAVLLTVALLASWLPARRAAKTDPMETLRAE